MPKLSNQSKQILDFSPVTSVKLTLQKVAEDYLRIRRISEDTRKDYQKRLSLLQDWMPLELSVITKQMVRDKHQELSARGGRQADMVFDVFRAIWNFALRFYDNNGLTGVNPVFVLNSGQLWNGYKTHLNDHLKPHQIGPFFNAIHRLPNADMRDYITFLFLTGARRSEVSRLKWSDVFMKKKVIIFRKTRNGRSLTLPVSTYLLEILKRRKQDASSEYVFPGRFDELAPLTCPERALRRIASLTGITVRPHALRRSFCTIAANRHVRGGELEIKAAINHRTSDCTWKSYMAVDIERVRELIDRVSAYVLEQAEKAADKDISA